MVVIVLIVIVLLDKGGERTGSTRVDMGFEGARRLSFVSCVGSTGEALLWAPRHGDRFILPVNLGVVLT